MKLGHILATASWISVFALIWLMIAEVVDGRSLGFLIFFLFLAVITSAILASESGKKEKKGSNGRHQHNIDR